MGIGRSAVFIICVLIFLFYSSMSFSWSSSGHRFISKQTHHYLSEQERQYLNQLTGYLDKPSALQKMNPSSGLYQKIQSLDGFEQLSSWPDHIRDVPLKNIFSAYDQAVPEGLWAYKKYNTSDWHYSNAYIYSSRKDKIRCNVKKKGRLQERLFTLHETLQAKLTKTQEAIVMAFFLHLVQDLHQPLHLVSKVNSSCSSDLGGNKACLVKKRPFVKHGKNRCRKNLHHLWDQGFGAFNKKAFNSVVSASLVDQQQSSISDSFSEKLISSWIDESRQLSDSVYSLSDAESMAIYSRGSNTIVKAQVERATLRSLNYLQYYLNSKHSRTLPQENRDSHLIWQKIKHFLRILYDA